MTIALLAAAAVCATRDGALAQDFLGKTVRFEREGYVGRYELKVLRDGRVFARYDAGRGNASRCPGGGFKGDQGIIGQTISYTSSCGGPGGSTNTTTVSANGNELRFRSIQVAGHRFFDDWRIEISAQTCSGTLESGYTASNGSGDTKSYTVAKCRVSAR